jgi:hypothetical protein
MAEKAAVERGYFADATDAARSTASANVFGRS